MKTLCRVALIAVALLAVPAAAFAQWDTPNRAFHKDTAFPLEGKHQTVACASCHINGVMQGTPTSCYGCHWIRRQDDPYRTRLGTACDQCHRPTAWSAVKWDHGAQTGMPLNGAHKLVACDGCHKNNAFTSAGSACINCHQKDFNSTTSPNHAAAGFSTACETCHRVSDVTFSSATFNHNSVFPLIGVHAAQSCVSCHANNRFQGTPTNCVGCHLADYTKTSSPNHAAAGMPTTCDSCHRANDVSWGTGGFNHSQYFALVGLHATVACSACHVNNVYAGTRTDCYGCHQTDFTTAKSPNHMTSGFSTACDSCHKATDQSWQSATFNHASVYPLVGVHATVACSTCHVNGVYKGTPATCAGCHQKDYDQSKNPSHAAAGFSTSCDSCHNATDTTWQAAALNHNQFFPLVGQHAMLNCSACHLNNVYIGTPRLCYPCHKTLYDQTANPNHVAALFPTTCDTCHKATDATWLLATFTHTWFPITSGKHAGNACSACHNNPSNYAVFTCLTCHDRTRTDSQHKGRSGYAYDSNRCYACHPTGRAG